MYDFLTVNFWYLCENIKNKISFEFYNESWEAKWLRHSLKTIALLKTNSSSFVTLWICSMSTISLLMDVINIAITKKPMTYNNI